MLRFKFSLKGNKGFTLLEILIALVISGIFLLALTNFFISTNKLNTVQQKVSEVQQNVRTVMELISRDIRTAGLDPTGTAKGQPSCTNFLDIVTDTSITIRHDYNGDGKCGLHLITDPAELAAADESKWEVVTYKYENETIMFQSKKKNGDDINYPLAELGTISSVKFEKTSPNIVTVGICGKITGAYKDDYDSEYCFTNEIKLRNPQ
jgi:prepilin-type N-terminal cleavage/methylation domain-containing protein